MNDAVTTAPTAFFVHPSRLTSGRWDGECIAGQGDICASYSADRISDEKPIRKPFQWQGSLWVCVGSAGRGCGVRDYARAYRLISEDRFTGAATTYSAKTASEELCETARNDPMGGYHGVTVRHKGARFVLCGPEASFLPDMNVSESPTKSGEQLTLF